MKKLDNIPQKERKHQAIINAATQVFLQKGFELTSMDEVAKQAGVSKRTVYDHFVNKENLFQAILADHWNAVFELDQPLFDKKAALSQALIAFAKKFMGFLYQAKTIGLFRLLISESNRFPDLLAALVLNGKAPFTRELIAFIEEKKKNGQLKITNSELAAAFFIGMLKEPHFWPMMLGFIKDEKPKNMNKIIKATTEVFITAYT